MAYMAASWKSVHRLKRAASLAGVLLGLAGFAAGAGAQSEAPAHGDLSVNDAVRIALSHNPDLGTAQENVHAAAGARNVARQNYLPRLSASYTRFHSYNSSSRFDQNTGQVISSGTPNSWSTSYALSQNIFDLPSALDIRAAGKDLASSRYDYAFSRTDLVLAVKQQYYALLGAQLLAAVDDSALAVAQRELDRTQSLFELGMVARSDVLKQQVQVSTSRLDAINAHADVVNQRARLAQVLGQDPTDDLRASDQLTEVPVAVDSAAIVDAAIRNRPDLTASRLSLDAQRARAGAARAGFLPAVAAQLALRNTYTGGLVPFHGFAPDTLDSSIPIVTSPTRGLAITLSVPFFDGVVGRVGTIQQASARAQQAQYAYDKLRLQVEADTRSAINSARQANEGIEVAKSGLESAQEDLKLSQEKYNVGSGTILDLLNAQVNLQKAQQQYVVALTQARIAEAQIERARGIVP